MVTKLYPYDLLLKICRYLYDKILVFVVVCPLVYCYKNNRFVTSRLLISIVWYTGTQHARLYRIWRDGNMLVSYLSLVRSMTGRDRMIPMYWKAAWHTCTTDSDINPGTGSEQSLMQKEFRSKTNINYIKISDVDPDQHYGGSGSGSRKQTWPIMCK